MDIFDALAGDEAGVAELRGRLAAAEGKLEKAIDVILAGQGAGGR